jgi:flavin-binding protein dodecin
MDSIARVTEISATSSKSFDDAVKSGVARASKTLRNVTSAWVKEQRVVVDGGKITGYQVNLLVTFVLEENGQGSGRKPAARSRSRR